MGCGFVFFFEIVLCLSTELLISVRSSYGLFGVLSHKLARSAFLEAIGTGSPQFALGCSIMCIHRTGIEIEVSVGLYDTLNLSE